MKNSFFSRFTPKEPKFFPLLKQLSEVLSASSVAFCNMPNRQNARSTTKRSKTSNGKETD